MKFKIGDTVKTRPNLKLKESTGGRHVTQQMYLERGKHALIVDVKDNDCYYLAFKGEIMRGLGWTEGMILPADPVKVGDNVKILYTLEGVQSGLIGKTGVIKAILTGDDEKFPLLVRFDEEVGQLRTTQSTDYYKTRYGVNIQGKEEFDRYCNFGFSRDMVEVIKAKPEIKKPGKPVKPVDQYQLLADLFMGDKK